MTMATPFGILFEEEASMPASSIQPEYDPEEQISFCHNECGEKIPFVIFGFATNGATGTATFTKENNENTDTDPEVPRPRPVGTQTISEIRETTDKDR